MLVANAVLPMLGRAARNDQLRLVQTAAQTVQVGEARGSTRRATVLHPMVEQVERLH